MFDVSFSELIVIAIVALVVIGPERLPKVARMSGHLLGRLQRYVNNVKADINREMQLDELKKLQSEMRASASELEQSLTQATSEMQSFTQDVEETVQSAVADAQVDNAVQSATSAMSVTSATSTPSISAEPLTPQDASDAQSAHSNHSTEKKA